MYNVIYMCVAGAYSGTAGGSMVVEWQDYGVSHTFASSPLRNHQYLLLYTHTHTMYSIHTYEVRPEAKFDVFLILVILGILVMEM